MPLAAMMAKLNQHLTAQAIHDRVAQDPTVPDKLRNHDSLVQLAIDVGGLDANEASYLRSIPPSVRQAIGAAVAQAAAEGKAVQIQYSPAYDFSVQVWDHVTGVSVHLSGPYPPDANHPRNSYEPPKG